MSEENGGLNDDEIKQAQEMVKSLDPLLKQPGWEYYLNMLQRQINVRRGRAPTASEDFGAVFKNEFQNGEVAGLMLAASIAPGALSAAKEMLTEIQEQEDGE